jgi:hypothetical protein
MTWAGPRPFSPSPQPSSGGVGAIASGVMDANAYRRTKFFSSTVRGVNHDDWDKHEMEGDAHHAGEGLQVLV